MIGGWRGPFGMTMRRCLSASAMPALLATAIGMSLRTITATAAAADAVPGAQSPWLVLPLVTIAIRCGLTAVRFWPMFGINRPGADSVRRLQRSRLRGCGAAIAGALLAQLLWSSMVLMLLTAWLDAPPARAHVELSPAGDSSLLPGQPPLLLEVPGDLAFSALQLRPLAGRPAGDLLATRIEVRGDGELLTTNPLECIDNQQLLHATFPARTVHRLQLTRTVGTVPLWFPRGSVVLIAAELHSRLLNAALVALLALLPTFVALALAMWCGRIAALPTVQTVVVTLVFVQMIGDVGPFAASIHGLLRGHWLLTGPVFPSSLPSLAVGFLAMIAAMLSPAGSRR